jgi:oligosaccharide 4-alpha-D-glucosyltransferase
MKRLLAVAVIIFFSTSIMLAQGTGRIKSYSFKGSALSFITSTGEWTFRHVTDQIIKTSFRPDKETRLEQVSNAVILPSSGIIPVVRVLVRGANPVYQVDWGTNMSIMMDSSAIIYLFNKKTTAALTGYYKEAGFRGFRYKLQDDERFFGSGERSVPLNRRGYKLKLYNNPWYGYTMDADNLNYSIPFLLSSAGYGIFWDNPSNGYLDIGKTNSGTLEYGGISGELTYYVIGGGSIEKIMGNYAALTGYQPIPPRWALGNFMSRFGYRSEAQIRNTLQLMKQKDFPVDAVIIDLFWFGDSIKGTMGNLDWVNRSKWPNPEGMISDLKKEGVKTILITEPFIVNATPNYLPSKRLHATDSSGAPFLINDFYFGPAGLLDIFKKETQNWFWTKYKPQIDKGVAGWWGDLGEPERHPAGVYHNLKDLGFNRKFSADEVHNIYGHYWDKMLFDRYAKEYPNTRLFNLNRSGYAGSARYGVFPWSGDVSRSWGGLQAQLPVMIGMSMSGVPYIHADAGGFGSGDFDPQLYTRWIQFAVFTPIFRPHGTALGDLDPNVKDIPSEPAFYEEPYESILRKFVKLRYELMPYNYTLAYQQSQYGTPLVRPLFYRDGTDSNLYKAGDQYLWGDAFLVAPVLNKDATERTLYLPKGNWYDWFNHTLLDGKRWITVPLSMDAIPLYVKEGSFVPMVKAMPNTEAYSTKELTVRYFPASTETSYTLFDDDGTTNNSVKKGAYQLLRFKGQRKEETIFLSVSKKGNFRGSPAMRTIHIDIDRPDKKMYKVMVNGKPVKAEPESEHSLRVTVTL